MDTYTRQDTAVGLALTERSDDLPFGSSAQLFLGSALLWFVVTSLITLIHSVQLFYSDWPTGIALLQPERLRAVYLTSGIFLWLSMALIGGALYIVPRLFGTSLWSERLGVWNAWLWNLFGVLAIISLLAGQSQGRPLAELVWPLDAMFIALVLMVLINLGMTLRARAEPKLYVSVWYMTVALLSFPVAYAIGNVMWRPGNWWHRSGIMTGPDELLVRSYYSNWVLFLWLTPLATALASYLIPVLARAPLYSRTLAAVGVWLLTVLGAAGGQLPYLFSIASVPTWLKTVAAVAGIGLLASFLTVAVNLALTMRGSWARVYERPPLKLSAVGLYFYALIGFETAAQGIPGFTRYSTSTVWWDGYLQGAVLGAFSLWALAAITEVFPALSERRLYSRVAVEAHFWLVTGGFLVTLLSLQVAALVEGALGHVGISPDQIAHELGPYWIARSVGAAMVLSGAVLHAWNIFRGAALAAGERAYELYNHARG